MQTLSEVRRARRWSIETDFANGKALFRLDVPRIVEHARHPAGGIDHAHRQRGPVADPRPDPTADPDAFERWAIRHEADALPPGALDFPFGGFAPAGAEAGAA